MMITDNFDYLSQLFDDLKSKEDFYYVQVIQRKKDGHRKSERIVKNFYIYNKESFLEKKNHIIELCKQHNARAYFWINPRNARKVALECVKSYADLVAQGDCTKGYKVWDKKCGSNPAPGYDHHWIVDVDAKDVDYVHTVYSLINQCRSKLDGNVLYSIPTQNGFHFITIGFDLDHFRQLCKIHKVGDIDVHKDNPTLLYYEKA